MHHKLGLRVIRLIATIVLPPIRAFAATIALISPLYSWSIFPARASLCSISDGVQAGLGRFHFGL
jgi:hypothetical protein